MSDIKTLTIVEAHAALMSALHDLGVQKVRWESEQSLDAARDVGVALRNADVALKRFVNAVGDGLVQTDDEVHAWWSMNHTTFRLWPIRHDKPLTERYRIALAEIERLRGRVRRLKGEVTKWCSLNHARRLGRDRD